MVLDGQEAVSWILGLGKFGSQPGLSRVSWLLEQLDHPQKGLPVVHVAGTNGKGSTCYILERILATAGYRVGMFTSPFVDDFTERMMFCGEPIPSEKLGALVSKLVPLAQEADRLGLGHPTQFEIVTVAAFMYYREVSPDVVILETGLGGRLDATNVVDPWLSIITNVGYDHMDVLGDSLPQIAREKAGIIKSGVPVITGADGEALQAIQQESDVREAPLFSLDSDFTFDTSTHPTGRGSMGYGQIFNYRGIFEDHLGLELSLIGAHQKINATLALAAVELLGAHHNLSVGRASITKGLQQVRVPIRVERFSQDPAIILDAAHNTEGIAALMAAIRELKEINQWDKIVYVLGFLADKPIEDMIQVIDPPDHMICTRPESPRAKDPWELAEILKTKKLGNPDMIEVFSDYSAAIQGGLKRTSQNGLLVIFGSFYLASYARKVLVDLFDNNFE